MTEHRLLTGASLHEPKGVESATNGQVYVANGSGSGTWIGRLNGINNLNKFFLNAVIDDVSTAGSNCFFYVPVNAQLTDASFVLAGTLTTANSVLSFYKNGVLQTQTLTVPYVGSIAGTRGTVSFSPTISFAAGDYLEIRSDGASDTVMKCFMGVTLMSV